MAEPLTGLGETGKGKEQCRNWQVPELGHGESFYETWDLGEEAWAMIITVQTVANTPHD